MVLGGYGCCQRWDETGWISQSDKRARGLVGSSRRVRG